jgi:hypothetical protein
LAVHRDQVLDAIDDFLASRIDAPKTPETFWGRWPGTPRRAEGTCAPGDLAERHDAKVESHREAIDVFLGCAPDAVIERRMGEARDNAPDAPPASTMLLELTLRLEALEQKGLDYSRRLGALEQKGRE